MAEAAHIKPLTSLRFFAAAWVVLFHYWPHLAVAGTPPLIAKGYLGVELFFVLSGFILCHVYLPQFEAGRFRYGDFLWARLARIYPMHIATLVGIGLMAGAALAVGLSVDPNVLSFAALPANLTLTQAWGLAPVAGWNHPSWSISAEWFAYLAFPAFATLTLALRRRPGVAVFAALAFLAVLYPLFEALAGYPLTRATTAWGALRIIPCFALGCALYLAWRSRVADGRKALAGACFFIIAVIAAACFQAPDALIVSGVGGLIFSLAQVFRSGSPRFSHPAFVYLGEISYSIYMVCIPWEVLFVNVAARVGHFGDKHLPPLLWLVFLFTLVPLAAVTHHLIEKPAREGMKRLRRSRTPHNFATAAAR
jgi:peptidoglycan/LPS O-acetylase OafA/YrhL